jgi:putative ribosome biogenesis GTPase RsgA
MNYTDEQKNNIIEKYLILKEQRNNASRNYINKISKTDEYREKQRAYYHANKEKMREKSKISFKKYYDSEKGKEKKKEYYESNKDNTKLKRLYIYYLKNDKIDKFIERHPEKYKKLKEIKYIEE